MSKTTLFLLLRKSKEIKVDQNRKSVISLTIKQQIYLLHGLRGMMTSIVHKVNKQTFKHSHTWILKRAEADKKAAPNR